MAVTDSILDSTKKVLGLGPEHNAFDDDIIMHINSALSTLNQLNVGPPLGYTITDNTKTWTQFMGSDPKANFAKTYVHISVRLVFDVTSLAGPVINALEKQKLELEWRLMVMADPVDNTNIPDDDEDLVIDGGGP